MSDYRFKHLYPDIPYMYIRLHGYSLDTNIIQVDIIARQNKI